MGDEKPRFLVISYTNEIRKPADPGYQGTSWSGSTRKNRLLIWACILVPGVRLGTAKSFPSRQEPSSPLSRSSLPPTRQENQQIQMRGPDGPSRTDNIVPVPGTAFQCLVPAWELHSASDPCKSSSTDSRSSRPTIPVNQQIQETREPALLQG